METGDAFLLRIKCWRVAAENHQNEELAACTGPGRGKQASDGRVG
jgi:hypothetical protein